MVWYKLNHPLRGPERGSITCDCSVHNQKTERLWKDVFGGIIELYYDIFYQLENLELLDPSSELNLLSFHYVFVPKINKYLNIWKDGWVNHKLSSEAYNTPLQLFISRMLDDDYQNHTFQGNVLVSNKFQLIIFTYFSETKPTYQTTFRAVSQIFGNSDYNSCYQYDKQNALQKS